MTPIKLRCSKILALYWPLRYELIIGDVLTAWSPGVRLGGGLAPFLSCLSGSVHYEISHHPALVAMVWSGSAWGGDFSVGDIRLIVLVLTFKPRPSSGFVTALMLPQSNPHTTSHTSPAAPSDQSLQEEDRL